MAPSKQLAALIFSLEDADSPFERMHRLALAWRSIRELSRQERVELARHAGFDGAEELLERLAARSGGLAPAVLLEAIDSARKADPSKLKALFAGLREPGKRGRMLADTLLAMGRAAAEELGLEETEEEGPEASDQERALTTESAPNEPAATEEEPALEPGPQYRPSAAVQEATEIPTVAREDEELPQRAADQPPAAQDEGPDDERDEAAGAGRGTSAAGPEIVPESAGAEGAAHEPRVEVGTVPEPGASTLEPGELEESAGADRLLARLLRLRSQAPMGGTGAELERLLAGFPRGWPRRRALSALIENGAVGSASLALDLVAELDAERDRAWCLGLVVRTWQLTDSESERALALVSSPSRRRRLLRSSE